MPEDRMTCRLHVLAAAALAAASLCIADVDLELRNADQVKGTLNPGTETETFRLRLPQGARLTLSARSLKKGMVPALVLRSPAPADVARGNRAGRIVRYRVAASGEHTAVVTSKGGVKKGDYAFTAGWTSPTRAGPRALTFTGAGDPTFRFAADAGARVRVTVTSSTAVVPRILSISGPDGDVTGADDGAGHAVEKTPSLRLPGTGDYVVTVTDASPVPAGGTAKIRVQITPPRASRRKIDITARKTGVAGADGAFARIVEAAGGSVTVPDGVEGLESIAGTSITIARGVLPSGASIVIASAPPIPLKGGNAPIGPPVYFGPEGLKLGTPGNPGAHVSIPVDVAYVGGDTSQIRVFTRTSLGKVQEIDRSVLDFTTEPGFVRFPVSHFSSYVAAAAFAPGGSNLVTIVGGRAAITDVATNFAADAFDRVYFLADGSARAKEVVLDTGGGGYVVRDYAGGGATVPGTTAGVQKADADFGGPVVAVASSSDFVYVGTDDAVFRVDVTTGLVVRFAGTGVPGDSGDDGPAASALITSCADLLEDQDGNLWIVDTAAARVRRVDAVSGNITTVAGTGTNGSNGDLNPATQTLLDAPAGITEVLGADTFAVCERGRVRLVDPVLDTLRTLAGDPSGALGCAAPGATGTAARFDGLNSIAYDPIGDRVIVGSDGCDTLFAIAASTGAVTVRFGVVGSPGFRADGAADASARATNPRIVSSVQSFDTLVDFGGGAGDARIRFLVSVQ